MDLVLSRNVDILSSYSCVSVCKSAFCVDVLSMLSGRQKEKTVKERFD